MSDLGQMAKQSVADLGKGAYAATILPSLAMVLIVLGLLATHLLPWQGPIVGAHGAVVPLGLASITDDLRSLSAADAAVLVIVVVLGTLLLRPFNISMVRILEGYWDRRGIPVLAANLGVERHVRRLEINLAREQEEPPKYRSFKFKDVDMESRAIRRAERMQERAIRVLRQYPTHEQMLPTTLGNVLRRGETTAGERYGLSTLATYPRLYNLLSDRLDSAISSQVNVLDATAAFVFVFGLSAALTTPLVVRHNGWTALPVTFALASAVCYRGAVLAAGYWSVLAATAYDLHRLELIKAVGLPLPADAREEFSVNTVISAVFEGTLEPRHADVWTYETDGPERLSPKPIPRGAARPQPVRRSPRR